MFPARRAAGTAMGYIDAGSVDGAWRIEPQFDEAGSFREGVAVVRKNGRSAAIDVSGATVVPWFDGLLYPASQGLMCFAPNGSIALNAAGRLRQKWLGKPGDDPFPSAWWRIDGKVGFMDVQGRVVIPPRFEPKLNFLLGGCGFGSAGYAAMRLDGKEGLIDRSGKWVVSPEYEYLGIVFSGNRKVVAVIADKLIDHGIFLDTVERLDGFMGPDGDMRWRETGPPRESVIAGGLVRAFVNHMLFPRWQQQLTNQDVSSRMLLAWVSSLLAALVAFAAVIAKQRHVAGRWLLAPLVAALVLPLVFLLGLLSMYLLAAVTAIVVTVGGGVKFLRRRRSGSLS